MILTNCYWRIKEDSGILPCQASSLGEKNLVRNFKRRLTPLASLVFEALYKVLTPFQSKTISWVASSRHGDTDRMVRLFSNIHKQELSSPTDFSLSVHNAIVAMHSITTRNEKMNTALSGGKDSFELGLLEAYALQKNTQEAVGYIYYDFPLPSIYNDLVNNEAPPTFCALILENKSSITKGASVQFLPNQNNCLHESNHHVSSVIEFLKNGTDSLQLFVPGGFIKLDFAELNYDV